MRIESNNPITQPGKNFSQVTSSKSKDMPQNQLLSLEASPTLIIILHLACFCKRKSTRRKCKLSRFDQTYISHQQKKRKWHIYYIICIFGCTTSSAIKRVANAILCFVAKHGPFWGVWLIVLIIFGWRLLSKIKP